MSTRELLQKYAVSPEAFRADLRIEQNGELMPLGKVIEPWQEADFEATDAGWMRCAGRLPGDTVVIQRAYLERPRGHSKTSDLAVSVTWAMAFATRPIRGYAAAADKDQARLLRDAIARLIRNNPWLAGVLEVQNYCIKNVARSHKGADSQLEILSCDVGSSYGLLPDFIVCDELTHWAGGGDLWHSLISSAAKRPACFVQVITNAGSGAGSSWQWDVREAARTDAGWYFSCLDGPHARWITPRVLAEQQRLLPPKVYQRLWLNQWSTGGDAFDLADVSACINQSGPLTAREPGYEFVGGLDLGISRDHCALVILGAHRESQRIRLAGVQSWAPPPGGKIDLGVVREAVFQAHKRYALQSVEFDPYQCELMAQDLQRSGVPMHPVAFVGTNLNRMAASLVEAIQSRKIDLYDEPRLIADLTSLNIVPRSYGLKLEAGRDQAGHADRATALAIALPKVMDLLARKRIDLAAWLDADKPPLSRGAVTLLKLLDESDPGGLLLQEAPFAAIVGNRTISNRCDLAQAHEWRLFVEALVDIGFLESVGGEPLRYRLTARGCEEAKRPRPTHFSGF